jgi:hypothetical protein
VSEGRGVFGRWRPFFLGTIARNSRGVGRFLFGNCRCFFRSDPAK